MTTNTYSMYTPLTRKVAKTLQIAPQLRAKLVQHGVATLAHVHDLSVQVARMEALALSLPEQQILKNAVESLAAIERTAFESDVCVIPPMGMVLDPAESPELMRRRTDSVIEKRTLAEYAESLKPLLPRQHLLTNYMQPVRNQGYLGSCTGFGSVNTREYLTGLALSPGYAYRGAKRLDGYPQLEGSWQEFAFEFMVRHGAVLESEYPYCDCLDEKPIDELLDSAGMFKIKGYIDLLVEAKHLSTVLKAALSGQLLPDFTPRPVAISVATYDSFCDRSSFLTGVIPVPTAAETRRGGHAMSVCGYTQLYGVDYFVVINSWGTQFAKESPLGLPGYALIPEAYINQPGLVCELLMPFE
ncbi:TPA: hypothetical protein I7213_09605 [Vibrio vulnificus]|nr:hypothetical protein [Vibrio vulnificus]HDY7578938.1 hypothetical protein [Vibrio vulnificus]